MEEVNLEDVLLLEDEFYKKGYQEGQDESAREQYLEGKVYGLQTGFQRFLVIGYMRGLLDEWNQDSNKLTQTHLAQLEKYIGSISMSNDDAAVQDYEKALTLARNKVRVISAITKSGDKVAKLDELIREVGGTLQVSENVDDMW